MHGSKMSIKVLYRCVCFETYGLHDSGDEACEI
jgi:hypothetical protein